MATPTAIFSKSLFIKSALALLLGSMLSPALAQFKYKDANGRWVYSDQPPSAGQNSTKMSAVSTAPSLLTPPIVSNKDDKQLASKRAEADKQAAGKEQQTKAETDKKNQVACDETRANLKVMQGEQRVKVTDAKGEVKTLNDDERQTQAAAAQKVLASNCKTS
jgi:Domain of unknown function (DUF4124)